MKCFVQMYIVIYSSTLHCSQSICFNIHGHTSECPECVVLTNELYFSMAKVDVSARRAGRDIVAV